MNKRPLYFDYAATTPVDERVIQVMLECLGFNAHFGNPASSSHAFGREARGYVERARQQVAQLVGAQPEQIVWTSGATESNNLALKGVMQARGVSGGHVITSQIEHKAVLDTARQLQEAGVAVTYLVPDADGLISAQAVSEALRDDTFLVSLMLVNNELGTLNDIPAIGEVVRERGALLHVDAAQGAGKVAIDLARWPVDLMSFSAHKLYGPKGIGALYVGPRAQQHVQAQIHGGGHEGGLRSGTLATHQIAAMGAAFALAGELFEEETAAIVRLRGRLLEQLAGIAGLRLNGSVTQRIPHTLSLTFTEGGFDGAALGAALAFSATSACNSASNAPSHVLLALGHDAGQAARTIRLSLGRFTCEQDVDRAAQLIQAATASAPAFWATTQP
ncbi:aminotransferase class V-fold PLP-dependent enzyme [Pseudomonas protegens]|jgi:cysteine desulfurase|uniref:cysteine desulfurase n=2 Tax=Pseudomonas protegens TaxID=380021 RepID=Q4K939_PSEF5|nr:aminotransferase class V-fold PLP-dependent enzyme [Pseudomonas protegens]AAY93408.1 aminotransferase, class V [Pseudomonas protegens Pf-5]ASE22422.1 aminotransferase class V-fold PLP-dependent enzyme [Pseudomonas protegens]QEZ53898.1 aminotransferase class V-fold PLP-dependent enzyme [Pseudomonas protegens]QEZ59899.1 aminotransferase class V-fold PLP-dependent enzyme [Pseudomonas protegens]QEZ65181.1 aminotransferase class V-fold PLP-dependent enzyme [Pseudomonas protegens]